MVSLKKLLTFSVPVLVGVAAIGVSSMLKSPPAQVPVVEKAAKVRAVKAPKLSVIPRAVGYGTVGPARAWTAVSEVTGPVTFKAEELKSGGVVAAGMELLRIDPASYDLAVNRIQAQIDSSKVKERTTRQSLEIAKRDLQLLADDLARKQELAKKGTVAKVTVEGAERALLAGRTQAQNLENTLAVTIADRRVLEADLNQTQIDLENTAIVAPYDARITEVLVDEGTSVNKGQVLFKGDGLNAAEVEAQFPIGSLRPLIFGKKQAGWVPDMAAPMRGAVGIKAVVRLQSATHSVAWDGVVDRVSGSIDPQTQSLGIVVRIDDPYAKANPGERPALTRNTFVEVELVGEPLTEQVVVPASAVHDGKVYVVGEDNRLAIQPVQVLFDQGNAVMIAKGLKPGTTVVSSDLNPAIAGMLLDPVDDKKTKMRMVKDATGTIPDKAKSSMGEGNGGAADGGAAQ